MGAVVWFLISRMELWLVAAIAYFCGCFNGAVIISKYILRDDVRRHGSGNAGLTNFYRTFGGPLTFVVILCDVLKAVIAVLIAAHIGGGFDPRMMPDMPLSTEMTVYYVVLFKYWAALFCLLGHMFPCMFHFKGGKGILSGGTLVLLLNWRVAAVAWALFLLLWLTTRYVSLASITATCSAPITVYFVYGHNWLYTGLCLAVAALVVWCHRENIQRLLHGTEKKFKWHVNPTEGKDPPK